MSGFPDVVAAPTAEMARWRAVFDVCSVGMVGDRTVEDADWRKRLSVRSKSWKQSGDEMRLSYDVGKIPLGRYPALALHNCLKLQPSNFGNGMLYCASLCTRTRQPREESFLAATQHSYMFDEELMLLLQAEK